jgi:hypothetical protein
LLCYAAEAMTFSEAFEPNINCCLAKRQVPAVCAPPRDAALASTIAKYRDCFQVWILPGLGGREIRELNQL